MQSTLPRQANTNNAALAVAVSSLSYIPVFANLDNVRTMSFILSHLLSCYGEIPFIKCYAMLYFVASCCVVLPEQGAPNIPSFPLHLLPSYPPPLLFPSMLACLSPCQTPPCPSYDRWHFDWILSSLKMRWRACTLSPLGSRRLCWGVYHLPSLFHSFHSLTCTVLSYLVLSSLILSSFIFLLCIVFSSSFLPFFLFSILFYSLPLLLSPM